MWCKQCGQDVPGISSAKSGGMCCARCSGLFSGDEGHSARRTAGLAEAAAHGVDLSASQPAADASASFDDWELDQNFRHLQARVGTWKRVDAPGEETERRQPERAKRAPKWRVDGAHAKVPSRHKRRSRAPGRGSFVAWTVLSLGLMAFACGAVLLGWSFVAHRAELWSLGMPITVAGQVGLLLGLVLQLERIWQNSRYAVRKLDEVDSQLHHLERTTTMLNVTHSSAAQAFYAHMADDADPQMLLADLKGQLDLLARSMSKR
jgi:hypothetical protein